MDERHVLSPKERELLDTEMSQQIKRLQKDLDDKGNYRKKDLLDSLSIVTVKDGDET